MSTFKPGQRVRCIDASPHGATGCYPDGNSNSVLKKDAIYTIDRMNLGAREEYYVVGFGGSCKHTRFVACDENVNPSPTSVVDDYVCKRCSNNKCSTTEKSCWKCGEAISP